VTWLNPPLFNYVILALYMINVVHHLWHLRWFGVCYWLSAAAITATVTFLKP